jgi:hypothetical protein
MKICYSCKVKSIKLPVSFTVAVIKSEQYDKHWVNSEAHKLAKSYFYIFYTSVIHSELVFSFPYHVCTVIISELNMDFI